MDLSPRKTRAHRRQKLEEAAGESSPRIGANLSSTTSQLEHLDLESPFCDAPTREDELRIQTLPGKLTANILGISNSDLKILLRKRDWLRKYTASLPDNDERLRSIVDASLVFGQEEAGTAVCISPKGLLLTCSHCIAESEQELDSNERHCLLFASGRVVRARCTAWDSRRDLALLQIVEAQGPADQFFPSLAISTAEPKLREPLICVGHPGSDDLETSLPGIKTNYDTLHVSSGAFRGYAKDQNLQDNSEIGALKHDCWTYWGHSGAPLVSRKSLELVGLHSSWDDQSGMRHGVPLQAIREFLEEHGGLES